MLLVLVVMLLRFVVKLLDDIGVVFGSMLFFIVFIVV